MTPKLSIIITVYNLSKYLDKCLCSVINQTLRDIEIIVVNDGSTDNSLSIIEKYASTDNRIKIIDKKNEGVAYARKAGVEIATGDYVHHLDGDDFLELNCYETLYKKAIEQDADMVIMKFLFVNFETNKSTESDYYGKEELTNIEFLKRIWSTNNYYALWQFIHKRSLYENKIEFIKGLTIGEDAFTTTQLGYYSKKIVTVNSHLLHYIVHSNSAMTSGITEKKANDTLLYPVLIDNFMKTKPEYDDVKVHMLSLKVQSRGMILMARYFKDAHKECKAAYQIVKQNPEIFKMSTTRPYRKLIKLYAISTILGRLFAAYYIAKGKIK